jgi:hypothetical protein
MQDQQNTQSRLFDEWPDRYDEWFQTPVGALVKHYENELIAVNVHFKYRN